MKKDYSKVFSHYYGLQYDGNVSDMIKIHQLMEDAGMQVSSSTKDKLAAYSDKRPFRVNYFISKVGKTLKWCPTSSPDKFSKMTLMPAAWWIEQLSDEVELEVTGSVELPKDWLTVQLTEHVKNMMLNDLSVTTGPVIASLEDVLVEEYEVVEEDDDTLPF
jgi:hypothetical protein